MKDSELVKILKRIDKPFYNIQDLEKITGLKKESLYVALNRWQKSGVLERIGKGLYVIPETVVKIERIAAQLYIPNYLSFESALSRYGILNLVPYAITFATSRKTKKITILNRLVEYRQIKKELFFGFEMEDGIYIASPEKAMLDMLYLVSLGKATLNIEELNLKPLSKNTLLEYANKFPSYVKERLKRLQSQN